MQHTPLNRDRSHLMTVLSSIWIWERESSPSDASDKVKEAEVVLHVKQEKLRLRFGKYELKLVEVS